MVFHPTLALLFYILYFALATSRCRNNRRLMWLIDIKVQVLSLSPFHSATFMHCHGLTHLHVYTYIYMHSWEQGG